MIPMKASVKIELKLGHVAFRYTDAFGLHRRVEYVADENGFRADVKSNEPGVKGDQPASARFTVEEVPRVLSTG